MNLRAIVEGGPEQAIHLEGRVEIKQGLPGLSAPREQPRAVHQRREVFRIDGEDLAVGAKRAVDVLGGLALLGPVMQRLDDVVRHRPSRLFSKQ